MKLLKMFGLAAIAASMAMAFASAGSAMAESTALCDSDPGMGNSAPACAANHLIAQVHEVTLTSAKAKLLSNISIIECAVLFSGDVDTAGRLSSVSSSPASLEIHGSFTYENCSEGCTVFEESAPSTVKILKESHETGKVTYEIRIHVECALIDCVYSGGGLVGTAKGRLLSAENNGEVSLSEQVWTPVSGFCPLLTKLDIVTTPLVATHITK